MSVSSLDLHTESRADAKPPPSARHLVVWVGNNPQAQALVRHAAELVAASATPWTAICVETPGAADPVRAGPQHALQALQLAERLGATTASVSADSVINAVVERVRSECASMVLIGGHAPDGWLDGLQRPWLGSLADALSVRLPGVVVDVVHFPDTTAAPASTELRAASELPRHGWLRALAVVALCTVISETMLPYLEPASVATVYLAGVVFVALRLGGSAAVLAVVASILMFDLLAIEPRWSLKPTDAQYHFTFLVMLIVGILVSRLADHARQQARVADARARRAQALNELAGHLVSAQAEPDIRDGLAAAVRSTFGAQSALLLPDDHGQLIDPCGFCRAAGSPDGAPEIELAQRAFDSGPGAESVDAAPTPGQLLCLPLQGASGPLGVLAVRLPGQRFATPEDRRLLDAFANQAALALERSLFARRSAKAVVEAETERLRNTLLSGISHDFRTPLTTIIGSASSLLEQGDVLDDTQRSRLLQDVLGEARRMHASMTDLLELTRMEEGAVQASCEWCPADDLIDEVLEALGTRLARRCVDVRVPPDAVVWCDPRLVGQVLVNLLDNALRHTPAHCRIEIRVELGDRSWRLIVADDGPGLPPGQEHSVFKKFMRVRGEPCGTGTGLGLAICAAVARLHGGTMSARNDGGACFTLTLPQAAAANRSFEEDN